MILTLTALELVLGIDNVIFISILSDKLPKKDRQLARRIGLLLAMGVRIALLFTITWIIGLKVDIVNIGSMGFSGRDLILLGGGLFLIYKTGIEIWHKIAAREPGERAVSDKQTFLSVIIQIILIDIVFSFDSILTAVGLVDDIVIMVIAVVLSMGVMLFFADAIANFVHRYPGIKMLALVFLIAIGIILVVEGLDVHVEKGYIYFAMVFSLLVELLNIRSRAVKAPKPNPIHAKSVRPRPDAD